DTLHDTTVNPKTLLKSPTAMTNKLEIQMTPTTTPSVKQSKLKRCLAALLLLAAMQPAVLAAQAPVNLRGTARFAVLAASEITSVPTAAVKGDVGLSPAARSKIAGLTSPEVTGSILAADDGGATAVLL